MAKVAHTPANGEFKPLTVEELEAEKAKWEHRQALAAAEVSRLEKDTFAAVVQGREGVHRAALADVRAKANEASLILAEIGRQLPEAQAHEKLQRAADLRKQAAALQKEAGELDAQIRPALDEIERIMGVRYLPPAVSQFSGRYPKSDELRRQAETMLIQAENLEFSAEQFLAKRNGKNGHH